MSQRCSRDQHGKKGNIHPLMVMRRWRAFYGLAALVCMLSAATCVDIKRLRRAEEEKRLAVEQKNELSDTLRSWQLAREVRSLIKDYPDLALLLAVEVCEIADTPEARGALLCALQSHPQLVRFIHGQVGWVEDIAFGAGGLMTIRGRSGGGSIGFWDPSSGKFAGESIRVHEAVSDLAISPDGNTLALVSGGRLHLWDFRTRRPVRPPIEIAKWVDNLVFSPDGVLAGETGWGELQLWDSQTGKLLSGPVQAHPDMIPTDAGGVFRSSGSDASWVAVNTGLPDECTVRSLAVSGRNVLAGTYEGVFKSMDNGATWKATSFGSTNGYISCLVLRGADLFAGTDCSGDFYYGYEPLGGAFVSKDGGETWKSTGSGLTNSNVRALATSGPNLFAGTDRGVFLSADNGATWKAVNSGLDNTDVYCLAMIGPNLFAGTDGGGVFLSTDNGASWTAAGLMEKDIRALAVIGPNLFAGTDGGGVFLSTDNGASWTAVNSGLMDQWVQSLAVSGTNLFAGTESGVYKTSTYGARWTGFNSGLPGQTEVLSLAVSGNILFAGTYGGGSSQSNGINGLVFSPDGATLVSGAEDGTIHRWGAKSLAPAGCSVMAHLEGVASLAFHPDGKTLASSSNDGEIRLWNWPDMKPVGEPISPYSDPVQLAYTPEGVLVSVDVFGTICQWNGKTLEELSEPIPTRQGFVWNLAVRSDGMVATGGSFGIVILWDLKAKNRLMTPISAYASEGVAFIGDDQLVAAGEHGILRYWSIHDRKLVREAHAAEGQDLSGIAVSASGRLALGLDNGSVQIADPATGNLSSPVRVLNGMLHGLAFNRAGDRLAAGDFIPGALRILDAHSNAPVTPLVQGELGYLWDIAFHPDDKVLAACGESGMIRLFDAHDLRPITRPLQVHRGGMNFLAFRPDGRLAVAGGSKMSINNFIQFRDGMTAQPVGPAITTPPVHRLVFMSGGKLLVGGGFDGEIRLWDGRTLQFLGVLTGNENWVVRHLAASVDGKIAAAFDNGNVEIWDIDLASWKEQARFVANRELTPAERERFLGTVTSEGKK